MAFLLFSNGPSTRGSLFVGGTRAFVPERILLTTPRREALNAGFNVSGQFGSAVSNICCFDASHAKSVTRKGLMDKDEIGELRKRIEGLDAQIVQLLSDRARHAQEIGRLKHLNEIPVFDGCRERAVLDALAAGNAGPLPNSALRRIFTEIISACRALQGPTTVSFLGPEATFSHQAALEYFGRSCSFVPTDSIVDVFRQVEIGHVDFGVVPVENSTEGTVGLTLDQLAVTQVGICAEIFLRVSHALMSAERDLGTIERVFSHPQAIAQCLGWLSNKLPGRSLIHTSSTAAAAQRASQESGTAAVGSEMLAGVYGLEVLARDIQDRALNLTRFLVIGNQENARTGQDKTSVLFAVSHHPGALREALTPFAEQEVNISRIESRPSKETPWEYVFFLDLEGHLADEGVATSVKKLAACVSRLKILGSYPAGTLMNRDRASRSNRHAVSVSDDADNEPSSPLSKAR
ncbi:MAG: prephenate dehydratase [Deltaproteobacteria bacterium]